MVKQLSVFVQNEAGKLTGVTRAMADAGIDIRALSIADSADFGILRLLVSDTEKARTVLSGLHCITSVTDVTVVAVPDQPGGLAHVLELLGAAKVDIEYMYSLIARGENVAYMVFRVSDEPALLKTLAENGLNTVPAAEIGVR